ncbi:unnamed protein product [Lactuca virosa]|uniref:Uncharacterized protein n=1 Tax=Lactuca virosa TaxID=75947 RepID=A0AAU9M0T3_9ASTR|nr:unnamed protein product [Lactuca virosa]
MFFAGNLADDLGLPSIILRNSCAAFLPSYWIIPQLHQEGRFPIRGNDSRVPSIQIQRSTLYWPSNTRSP